MGTPPETVGTARGETKRISILVLRSGRGIAPERPRPPNTRVSWTDTRRMRVRPARIFT